MRLPFTVRIAGAVVLAAAIGGIFLYYHASHRVPLPVPTAVPVVALAPQEAGPVHTIIGYSIEHRAIDAYAYGTGTTHLLFVGGMHGGYEWNSVLLAYTFMDYLDAHPKFIPDSLTIVVIPSINPDGVYTVIGKEGRFALADVPASGDESPGRFNANTVDLNRNFDCKWQPESTWRSKKVSAGTEPFSEPEAAALRDFVAKDHPAAAVFWHSQAGAVYASQCENGILPVTLDIMHAYAKAGSYPEVQMFDAYATTGAADDWLASIGIPAITVELKTHATIEWTSNLAGIAALVAYFK